MKKRDGYESRIWMREAGSVRRGEAEGDAGSRLTAVRALRATPIASLVAALSLAARHRRQHRDLFAPEQSAAAHAAGEGARAPGHDFVGRRDSDGIQGGPGLELRDVGSLPRQTGRGVRRRHRVDAAAHRSGGQRRVAAGRRPRGQRRLLHDARCPRVPRPDIHRRRRQAWRRSGRPRRRHQLRACGSGVSEDPPASSGRLLLVEGVPFTIVGVTPPEFFGLEVGRAFDLAVPLGTEPLFRGKKAAIDQPRSLLLFVMLRLKPGQSRDAATAALRTMQPDILASGSAAFRPRAVHARAGCRRCRHPRLGAPALRALAAHDAGRRGARPADRRARTSPTSSSRVRRRAGTS